MKKDQELPKQPFDIDETIQRVRRAVAPLPKAAMFQLFDEGYTSLFEQLVACMISIRTLEEVTLPTARRLFTRARTPAEILSLPLNEIDNLIRTSSFHERKAAQILMIAQETEDRFHGKLPCNENLLLSFAGIGVKCAHLALGIACGLPLISVDIHVHRVTNRWGYVAAPTPEKSMLQLEKILPVEYYVEINRLLVPFGKFICTGSLPRCSTCVVLEMCRQNGVTDHR